ncbi:MAG: phosphotransferase [Sphingomonadaceae bacterium]|nr:phosphotransferase [Sphingomonadaceae bacterium]
MRKKIPGLDAFLTHAGWGDASADAIPGDASFRRYYRIREHDRRAMLMHAPPPHEDPKPFIHVANWLSENGLRAPEIYAADAAEGWVLLEDFGHARMRDWLDEHPADENAIYRKAIDALVELHAVPAGPFDPYDMATYQREAALLVEWYAPQLGLDVDVAGYAAAWDEALAPLLERQRPPVTVLRDYHAENIMLLDPTHSEDGEQGLIDFQDALAGHAAYDLVSLLQDARRDVSPALEQAMLDHYLSKTDPGDDFLADYALLGAQRNAKIVGIFVRLCKRDGKPHYLSMIPRVWEAMERDLAHPALAPVARWFDANIPAAIRAAQGGDIPA